MPHLRHIIDLSVPLTGTDTDALQDRIPAALRQKPTAAQLTAMSAMTWLEIFRGMVKRVKALSEKASVGDMAPKASTHICRHAEGLPCEEEQEI